MKNTTRKHCLFQMSKKHSKNPSSMKQIRRGNTPKLREYLLDLKPQSHFGEAFKRLQSLFFMLRDNEDVF